MPIRLLFLASEYFYQSTRDALQRMALSCETTVIPYRNFEHLVSVYQEHAPQYDACLVGGTAAKCAIELACPNITKPLVAFQVSSDAMHRDILRLAVETQSLDFSRIIIDFLIPLDCGCYVADYLALEDISTVITKTNQWMAQVGTKTAGGVENCIMAHILELWNQGAIDLVICHYNSIAPALTALGIPFRCPFPSDDHLKQLIDETLMKIELTRFHNNHPAIVQIYPRQPNPVESAQFDLLLHHVQQFVQQNMIDCILQQTGGCCVMITSMQVLRFLTNDFQICRLSAYLEKNLNFPVSIGYGIGTNVSHAMNNVQIASKEAQLLRKSFVVDTNGTLIGPLNSDKRMVISSGSLSDVSEIARRCTLSSMTIQKLMTVVRSTGSDKITTPELARQLDTTVRNANRIMLNLCKGNVAKPVYTQASHSRGRPIQVYALNFGETL